LITFARMNNKTIKVLVLSSLFPSKVSPNHGIFVREQLKEIRKLCSVVGVISPIPWMPLQNILSRKGSNKISTSEEEWDNIKVYHPRHFLIPKLTVYLNGFLYFISVCLFLRRKKELANFDILHVHFAYPAGFAGVLLGKMLKRRVVLSVRGTDINYFPKNPILKTFIKYALKNVEEIIAVSDALKEKVSELGIDENKITIIPNGINLELFKPISKKIAREKAGLTDHKKVILFVGSFVKVKGVEYLLEAFKEICTSNNSSGITLVLIGSGPLYATIKKKICDYGIDGRVLLKNSIPHKEIPMWMSSSDVFCLTSLNEGRPNVLYEAIACGIPVVATNVGGISEIIVSRKLGELVTPKNLTEIENALKRVLNKGWDIQSIRHYALSHSVTKYSEKVVEVYRKCLNMQGSLTVNKIESVKKK